MQIDIKDHFDETVITIQAKEWTEELAALVKKIQSPTAKRLVGMEEDRSVLLELGDIDYVFAENRKVFASMNRKNIELKMKLYEIEELLAPHQFMRFSKSVIGNLDKIERFELSFNGNLCVYFKSGSKEYVSRPYVSQMKKRVILGGGGKDGE
ncbi:LytTR family DNA-binding domain-containing protein [Paenibacillus sp. L3-i20]|uniref:LytTR family DNA-binding domain-containing protein n=1 Tax=Paenibacillus sp. L3-i20 TaxID=2905833 RepID=UPI001EDFE14F|nr:LytTR family DNA-binding domain-containing protein [Paenibacillus sp. L3-i20]